MENTQWESFCIFHLSQTRTHIPLHLHTLCSCMNMCIAYCSDAHVYLRAKNVAYILCVASVAEIFTIAVQLCIVCFFGSYNYIMYVYM